jgi:hypothetical protein
VPLVAMSVAIATRPSVFPIVSIWSKTCSIDSSSFQFSVFSFSLFDPKTEN